MNTRKKKYISLAAERIQRFLNSAGQFIQAKWQSFRTWQQQPIHYRLDESEHVCNNCGNTFTGNYCPVCSQSARDGRISWLAIWQGIGQLWGIDSRSGLYTLWQLLWRPGYLVRDFISGKRQVSYPPVKLLFILAAVIALIRYFVPVPKMEVSNTGYLYVDLAFNWMDSHQTISELLTNSIMILPTWYMFRNSPLYPNHSIPEGFFLQVYMAIVSFIFSSFFVESYEIGMLLTGVYMYATYKQLFGYGYWETLWRFAICSVVSVATLAVLAIIGIVLSKPDLLASIG